MRFEPKYILSVEFHSTTLYLTDHGCLGEPIFMHVLYLMGKTTSVLVYALVAYGATCPFLSQLNVIGRKAQRLSMLLQHVLLLTLSFTYLSNSTVLTPHTAAGS